MDGQGRGTLSLFQSIEMELRSLQATLGKQGWWEEMPGWGSNMQGPEATQGTGQEWPQGDGWSRLTWEEPATHLLMYSASSCFPHVSHLKQPKCQCLSKATRD